MQPNVTLKRLAVSLLAACLGLGLPPSLGAEDVTLTLRGGGLTVIGELIASDASSFVIKSSKFGVMALEAAKFDCLGGACPKSFVKLGIHGSNTIGAQLMPMTIERFAEAKSLTVEKVIGNDPEEVQYRLTSAQGASVAMVDLHSHGSGTAVPGLIHGKAQIGEMSRGLKPDEAKALSEAKIKVLTHIFALDGVLVLVSPDNPVKSLTLDQIAKIYSGEIKDWGQVGGKPGPITVYARDAKSGTYDTFDHLVLAPRSLKITPAAKRYESSPDLSDDVAKDKSAIGFAGFAYLRNAKALTIASECGISTGPGVFSVKTEEYPLSRRLYLRTVETLPPLSQKLLEFAFSDKAQDVISDAGFINQRIDSQSFSDQADRLAPALMVSDKDFSLAMMRELIANVRQARRLSMSFHFQKASSVLDEKALQDVPNLARLLKSDDMKTKRVLLIGFSDNTGSLVVNRQAGATRAAAVKNALVADGVSAAQINVFSYGNLLPVACNTTDAGKDLNRRVEVWIKD